MAWWEIGIDGFLAVLLVIFGVMFGLYVVSFLVYWTVYWLGIGLWWLITFVKEVIRDEE